KTRTSDAHAHKAMVSKDEEPAKHHVGDVHDDSAPQVDVRFTQTVKEGFERKGHHHRSNAQKSVLKVVRCGLTHLRKFDRYFEQSWKHGIGQKCERYTRSQGK